MGRFEPAVDLGVSEPAPSSDPRWDLVQRVARSAVFRRSRRLREFLLFACDRAVREPDGVLREQEVGTAVFGRPADFDTSHDTLVRVQASQLRKRLQQYFVTEGADEPVVIELPKGTYRPVFLRRARLDRAEPPIVTRPEVPGAARLLALAGLAAVLAASSAWLLLENEELRARLRAGGEPRPSVDRLWRQAFGNGRHVYVVLADSNLTLYQDLLRRQLSPGQYQRQQFARAAEAHLDEPLEKLFALRLMNRPFTSMADAALAHRVSLVNAAHGIPTDVILARDAGPRHLQSHNVVLSGPRRANPWVALFEEQLRFRSRFDEAARLAYLDDVAPGAGPPASYAVQWDRLGYCRVAYLPNLDGTGSVLLLSGTDLSSSEAGAEFVTGERWVRALLSDLGARPGRPIPHFEVLLRTHQVVGAAPHFERIAQRVVAP